jgi:hypothetical protein
MKGSREYIKQSWTADKRWSSRFRVGREANNSALYKNHLIAKCCAGPRTWDMHEAEGKGLWGPPVNMELNLQVP